MAVSLGVVGLVSYALWLPSGLVRAGEFEQHWIGRDFQSYYFAANAARHGENFYTAALPSPYIYPPLLTLLAQPFTQLSVEAATQVWKFLQHAALLASGVLLVRMAPPYIKPLLAGLLLFGLLTPIVREEVLLGQINSIILLMVVGGLWLSSKESTPAKGAGGALWGLAASIKVLPILLVPYLWLRGHKVVLVGAILAVLILQAIQLIFSPYTLYYWSDVFPSLFGLEHSYLDNQCINAAMSRALLPAIQPELPLMQLADGEEIRALLVGLANAAVLLFSVWVLLRSPGNRQPSRVRLLLEVSFVLLTVHLVSGSTWLAHLVDLSIVLTALLCAWWSKWGNSGDSWSARALLTPVVVIASLLLLSVHPADWVRSTAAVVPGVPFIAWISSNIPLIVLFGLWVATARLLLTPREQPYVDAVSASQDKLLTTGRASNG